MTDKTYASLNTLKIFLDNLKMLMDNHNISTISHNDMRSKIEDINTRLNTLADCDDETLDQISEIVAYCKDNRELIEQITTAKVSVSDLVNLVYPVGSIYMSANNISPSTFLGGTWEQIKDTFLLAAGSSYVSGSTGGEATHTLTVDEMPSHNHASKGWADVTDYSGSYRTLGAQGKSTDYTTHYTGGSKPHNNMPPYLVVYMWKRTA